MLEKKEEYLTTEWLDKMNFWQKKTRIRKNINLKNINILVIEKMLEDEIAKNESEAIVMLIENPELYSKMIEKLKENYPDIPE